MKKKISNIMALQALQAAVRTQPKGFVYNPKTVPHQGCEYFPTNDNGADHPAATTGCGIGVTLSFLGITEDEIRCLSGGFRSAVMHPESYSNTSMKVWKKIKNMLPQRAVDAYDVFQVIQDKGGSWDLALVAAERVFYW